MSKKYAFLYSVFSLLVLLSIAVALSFRSLWVALLLTIAYVFIVGFGFILKARIRRKKENPHA
ncbi:DUF5325 family protein [Longirhabdus pacifica]|uniref:DUF5325 family protein n=1 Tax=Longirhabdus pacifica TaxID=2305227 RepID=UPI00100885CF|nr:DUF5325 family protein [Longirhabdus pacifica]